VVDLRTVNQIPRSELLPENYKINDFMTLSQFVPGPKQVALIESKMQEDIAQGFSQALTIQKEERRIFRKFDILELPQNWDEAVLTVLQEKMRTSDPKLTSYVRKEIDKLRDIDKANDNYIAAKEEYLEEQAEYNSKIDKLKQAKDAELAAKIKLQKLEEEEEKALEALNLIKKTEETAKKMATEKIPQKEQQLKKSIENNTRTLKNIFIQELQDKYPHFTTKQLHKQFTKQNNRPKGFKISGDEYVALLIENIITESEAEKLQTNLGEIKKTTVFGKLIDQLRKEHQLSISDKYLIEKINKKNNALAKFLLDEESDEKIPKFKNLKSNPNISPHKAKTRSKLVIKKLEEEKKF
jgi:hypothetical protein